MLADSNRLDLLHMVGSALAGAGFADGGLVARLCMLGESAIIVPSQLSLSVDWQDVVVKHLQMRGLGAVSASIASDALNLH